MIWLTIAWVLGVFVLIYTYRHPGAETSEKILSRYPQSVWNRPPGKKSR